MAMLPRSLLWLFLCCFSSSVVSPSVSLSVSPVMFSAAFSGRISGYPSPCLTQLADTFIGTTETLEIHFHISALGEAGRRDEHGPWGWPPEKYRALISDRRFFGSRP